MSNTNPPSRQWVPQVASTMAEKPHFEPWLEPMEDLWENQKKPEICHLFRQALLSTDPRTHHSFVLDLLDHSRDLRKKKPDSLAVLLLREFDVWLKNSPMTEADLRNILTPELRMWAFHLAASSHPNVFDLLSHLYNLQGPDNSFLVSRIRVMLARQQFKEAATAVVKVNLQDAFTLDDICLPLIFQDKANMVEKYIQGYPHLQKELITRLDSFCQHGFDVSTVLSDMNVSVPGVRSEKLRPRHLSKLILRLVKMFKLDMELCPNTSKTKDLGAIKYLLYKKYIERTMAPDTWDELVASTIGDNEGVQVEFIELLVSYNDTPAAATWARRYAIHHDQLPTAVVEELQKEENASMQDAAQYAPEENWEDELDSEPAVDYYPLNLSEDRVILVDTLHGLQCCLGDITSKEDAIVGIDMEWRPSFTPTQKSKVALCQIATPDVVYLLDMMALWIPENQEAVKKFFVEILSSEAILKLGFEISGDYQMLGRSYPELQETVRAQKRTVDLCGLGKQVIQHTATTTPVQTNSLSLTELVFYCFGKYLDKRDRISDWERRPLRQSQVQYAALDAFCLLEVYQHLKERVAAVDLQINMEPCMSSKGGKKSKTKTKDKTKNKGKSPKQEKMTFTEALNQPRPPPISPGQLAVVCDNMLHGLGRHLRSCGVDVKMLDNEDDHDMAAEIARQEKRVILTSGAPYQKLKSLVEEGRCMQVTAHVKARYQVQQVLDYFNVVVTPQDIFSRCQVCNGNIYVKVSNRDMRHLWQRKQELLATMTAPAIDHVGDDICDDVDGMILYDDDDFYSDDDDIGLPGPPVAAKQKSANSVKHNQKSSTHSVQVTTRASAAHNTVGTTFEQCSKGHVAGGLASQVYGTSHVASCGGDADISDDFDPTSVCSQEYQHEGGVMSGQSHMDNSPCVYLEDALNFDQVKVKDVSLQVDTIPHGILDHVGTFYCCAGCGKVFWEGKHFRDVCSQFSHVLKRGPDRLGRMPETFESATFEEEADDMIIFQ